MKLKVKLPKAPKPKPGTIARTLVCLGAATVSVGMACIFVPAGVIAAGIALVVGGLYFVDVEVRP